MLPVLKSWRLNELRFPREFGPDALHYSGRVPGHRRLTIQLCWRPEDRGFCGEIFGMLSRQSIPVDNRSNCFLDGYSASCGSGLHASR